MRKLNKHLGQGAICPLACNGAQRLCHVASLQALPLAQRSRLVVFGHILGGGSPSAMLAANVLVTHRRLTHVRAPTWVWPQGASQADLIDEALWAGRFRARSGISSFASKSLFCNFFKHFWCALLYRAYGEGGDAFRNHKALRAAFLSPCAPKRP